MTNVQNRPTNIKNLPGLPLLDEALENLQNLHLLAEALQNYPNLPNLHLLAKALENLPGLPLENLPGLPLEKLPGLPLLAETLEKLQGLPLLAEALAHGARGVGVGEADHREFCRPSNLPWTPGSPWPTCRRGSWRWRGSWPWTPVQGEASSWQPRGSTCRRACSRPRASCRHLPSSSSRASGATPRQRGFGPTFASVKVAFLASSFSDTSSSAPRAARICPSAWRPSCGRVPLAPPHSTACLRRLMRPHLREPPPSPLQPRDPLLQQREPPPPGLTLRFPAPHPSEVAADQQAEVRLLRFPAPLPSQVAAHPQAEVRLLPRCHR